MKRLRLQAKLLIWNSQEVLQVQLIPEKCTVCSASRTAGIIGPYYFKNNPGAFQCIILITDRESMTIHFKISLVSSQNSFGFNNMVLDLMLLPLQLIY